MTILNELVKKTTDTDNTGKKKEDTIYCNVTCWNVLRERWGSSESIEESTEYSIEKKDCVPFIHTTTPEPLPKFPSQPPSLW